MELKGKNPSDTTPPKKGFLDLKNSQLDKGTAQYYKNIGSSPDAMAESPFESDYFNTKFLGIDFGPVDESAFNTKDFNNPFNPTIDFTKIRADKQSALAKVGPLAAQFLGKTTVGILGNIVGGFYGIGASIAEGDINKMFDNTVYRSLDEANESIEKKNTVFVNNNDKLGFNAKTAKELSDAFGFIASAVASELIMQTVGNIAGGSGLATIGGRLSRYLPKIGKMISAFDKVEDIEAMAVKLGKSVEEMATFKRNIDAFVKTPLTTGRRILTTTGYEAGLEARGAKDEYLAKMEEELDFQLAQDTTMTDSEKAQYKQRRLNQIKEDSDKVGMTTFLANTALLSASNAIQFPTIFGSGLAKGVGPNKIIREGIDKISKATSKRSKFMNTVGTVGRVLKNPATEFMEETGQGLFSNVSQNYYETMLGDQTNIGALSPTANNLADSVWKGLKDTYGTDEGLHEGIIGAIVGAIGIPGFKNKKLTMNGGIAESIREERAQRKYIEDAINVLNSTPLSDVVKYNRDNAIRASVDKETEDLAYQVNNQIELDSVDNNKVFRYTMERMSKGMEDFIQEDISDLRKKAQNIDEYKELFGKEEGFTKEDADKEIDAFEEKTKIYSDAYKSVHKKYNSNLLKTDDTSKKLVDVLTYAVATEKIYGDKLDALKQRFVEINNDEFTREELDEFITTSWAVRKAEMDLDKYIIDKELAYEAEVQKSVRDKMDKNYVNLLDISKEGLELRKKDLIQDPVANKTELEQIDLALKNKDLYDTEHKFNAKKSSKARKLQKNLDEVTKKINKKINDSVSRSMKSITNPPKQITRKELAKYVAQKNQIKANIDKEFKSKSTYELLTQDKDNNNIDLLTEINEITDKFMTATNIAGYLYGFRNNPGQGYSKILVSELNANLENGLKQAHILNFIRLNNREDEDIIKHRLEELKTSLEIIKKSYSKSNPLLSKEDIEYVDKQIKFIEDIIKATEKAKVVKKKLEKQEEEAKESLKEDPVIQEEEDAFDYGDVLNKDPEEPKKGTPSQKEVQEVDEVHNRFIIKDTFTTPNKGSKTIKELIESGKMQVNSPVKLTILENELNPNKNPVLKSILVKHGVLDLYTKGHNRLTMLGAEKAFETSTEDIETFIKFAPINLKINDKLDSTKTIYDQYLFAVTEDNKSTYDDYNKELDRLLELEKKELETNKVDKTQPEGKIKNKYIRLREEAYKKYNHNNISDLTNFRFRKELIANYLHNDLNELNLIVSNVDNGNIQTFKEEGVIKENPVEELGFTTDSMEINDIYYSNQAGEYVRIDGVNTKTITNHILGDKTSQTTGKIYFLYKDKSGRDIPLKMNTKKLGLLEDSEVDYAEEIYDQLVKYFESGDKTEFKIKNSKLPFINKRTPTMHDYLKFFLKNRQNKTTAPIFLKNAFSLMLNEANQPTFILHREDVNVLTINSVEQLKKRKSEIIQELKNSRFTIDSEWLLNEDKTLNREVLKHLLDNKIINHAFDTYKNYDNIYTVGYEKGITISDTSSRVNENNGPKEETYDRMLRKLRQDLGAENTTKEGYEANSKSIDYRILNDIKNKLEDKRELNIEDVKNAIREVLAEKRALVDVVANKFPRFAEDGKVLDKYYTMLNAKEKNLLSNAAKHLELLRFKEEAISKEAFGETTPTKKAVKTKETTAVNIPKGDLFDLVLGEDNPKEKPVSITDYLMNNTIKNSLRRGFTSENKFFNEGKLPEKILKARKEMLNEHNINNITTFVKIFEAFKQNKIVDSDVNIKKYAEKLFNDTYPEKC